MENKGKNKSNKKFIRYDEGAEMYSMSLRKFREIAKDANAIHKVGNMVLIKTEKVDEYLDTFLVEED